ncbi:hypothetical protein N752_21960 [Desulforamulus aquiferis]|nr:hypothetical protein [Desulforamulus aquiferis]RYD03079.1 hypothetical protein N752_21960 [Desulforamulus aquiferis]
MKNFQFKLEQVLQNRVEHEEKALQEQVRAQQECLKCREQLNEFTEKLENTIHNSYITPRPIEQMHLLMYRDQLQANIRRQSKLLQRLKKYYSCVSTPPLKPDRTEWYWKS